MSPIRIVRGDSPRLKDLEDSLCQVHDLHGIKAVSLAFDIAIRGKGYRPDVAARGRAMISERAQQIREESA